MVLNGDMDMLKYTDYQIVLREVPGEISLGINISNCPIKCKECHSKELWEDIGKPLSWNTLNSIIHINSSISAVCFLGGDSNPKEIDKLAWHIKRSTNLKVCWYSGLDYISPEINIANFDFIKVGHFNGIPINKEGTNQIFWEIQHFGKNFELIDQTKLFQVNDRNNKS